MAATEQGANNVQGQLGSKKSNNHFEIGDNFVTFKPNPNFDPKINHPTQSLTFIIDKITPLNSRTEVTEKDTLDYKKSLPLKERREFNVCGLPIGNIVDGFQYNEMIRSGTQYILLGPGRWGTVDRWIGIPVTWPQICNAKVIIETSLDDFPLDASSGSHFFHNVTSMNVGYFSVQHNQKNSVLDWDILKKQKVIKQRKYVTHVRFENSLTVKMDGKKRISVITWE